LGGLIQSVENLLKIPYNKLSIWINYLYNYYIKVLLPISKTSSIAKNIKKYREEMRISQDKLSKLVGVTLPITKIETGATPDPRIKTIKKIALVLKVTIDKLVR